jgi:hypothetical protein
VVVVGHHQLADLDTPQARIRALDGVQILEQQGLQREDQLRQFMDKQRQRSGDSLKD